MKRARHRPPGGPQGSPLRLEFGCFFEGVMEWWYACLVGGCFGFPASAGIPSSLRERGKALPMFPSIFEFLLTPG